MLNITPPGVLEDLDIGVFLHDPETGDVLYVNERVEEMYGYAASELRSMDIEEFSGGSYSQAEAVQRIQAAAAGNAQRFEWRARTADDTLLWIEVRLTSTAVGGTEYVAALVRDITGFKVRQRRDQLLSRITRHNLRNEANLIAGTASDLLDSGDASQHHDQLARIEESATELLGLTEWVAEVKSATELTEESGSPVDVADIVARTVESYREEHPAVDWSVDCRCRWATAGDQLQLAVEELLDNAVQHNAHHELRVEVTVREDPDTGQVCLRVMDTGRPIPDVEVEPIAAGYDPDPLTHGNGVGFWIVQSVAEGYGGRLSIAENSPERTVVEVALPSASPPAGT